MIQIKAEDTFQITGRGTVFAVDLAKQDLDTLVGLANYGLNVILNDELIVKVEDEAYVIRGIERFAQPMSVVKTKGKVGLLVGTPPQKSQSS